MKNLKDFMFILALVLCCVVFYVMGLMARQQTVKDRALELGKKECYTNQDTEIDRDWET